MTRIALLVVMLASTALAGCASLAVTVASVAGGMGVNHFTGSVQTRTFTEPMPQVRRAVLIALHRMKAEITPDDPSATPDQIRARLTGRELQIDFEALSASTTRIRTLARVEGGVMLDGATATEIIAQTEKAIGEPRHFVVAPANPLAASLPVAAMIPTPPAARPAPTTASDLTATTAVPTSTSAAPRAQPSAAAKPAAPKTAQTSSSGAARTAPLAK